MQLRRLIALLKAESRTVDVAARVRLASRAEEWQILSVYTSPDGRDVWVDIAPLSAEHAEED